ncbi:MAG: alpha/beta fold hydrolase, partial [Bacteroidota bacterium]
QRNHGRSPHADTHSYEAMAGDLLEFIETHNLRDVNLLGHSMGGKTVMEFAAEHADLIEKLIVVDIAPVQYKIHHDQIFEGLQNVKLDQTKSRGQADKQLAEYVSEADVRMFLLKNLYRTPEKSFAWRMNLDVLEENLSTISVPISSNEAIPMETLFIRGSRSNYVLDESLPKIEALFPNYQLETLEAGHWVHAEKPEEIFTLVNQFVG